MSEKEKASASKNIIIISFLFFYSHTSIDRYHDAIPHAFLIFIHGYKKKVNIF